MALTLNDIVRVTAQIAPQGVLRRDFGRTLFLHKFTGTPTTEKEIRIHRGVTPYSSADAVSEDWGSDHAITRAATIYFSQNPYPRNLLVGCQVTSNQLGYVFTNPVPGAANTVTALGANASVTFAGQSVTIDCTGISTAANLATKVQTGLRAVTGLNTASVTGSGTFAAGDVKLVITVPNDFSIGEGFADTATARTLGLADSNVYKGIPAESSVTTALDRIETTDSSWYFIATDSNYWDTDDAKSIADWVSARVKMLALDSIASAVLVAGEDTSKTAVVSALEQERVFAVWSATSDHKALSLAGRFSSVNFNQPNSLITGKFKSLPSTTSDSLSLTEKAELDRKRINHYSPFAGDNILAEGTSFGTWIDVRFWLDWFVNGVQTEVYNLLRQSPARVPQTAAGIAAIRGAIEDVCNQGVRNGGIAPGTVSPALAADIRQATSNADFDGVLTTGYLVSIGSLADQSQSDRAARKSPPVRIWVKGSGAVHFVDIDIVFEN